MTGNQDYLRMLDPVTGKLVSPVSSSCPANLHGVKSESSITEEDGKYYSKDRQKKDNHNISKFPNVVDPHSGLPLESNAPVLRDNLSQISSRFGFSIDWSIDWSVDHLMHN